MSRILAFAVFSLALAHALPSTDTVVPEAPPSFLSFVQSSPHTPTKDECQQCCMCPNFPEPTTSPDCGGNQDCEHHCVGESSTCGKHGACMTAHEIECDGSLAPCQACCSCPKWPEPASHGDCFGDPGCIEHCQGAGTCQVACKSGEESKVTCDHRNDHGNNGGGHTLNGPCDLIDPETDFSGKKCCEESGFQEQAECILKDHGPCDLVDPSQEQCCTLSGKVEQAACYCKKTSPENDSCCGLQDHQQQAACLAGMNLQRARHHEGNHDGGDHEGASTGGLSNECKSCLLNDCDYWKQHDCNPGSEKDECKMGQVAQGCNAQCGAKCTDPSGSQ